MNEEIRDALGLDEMPRLEKMQDGDAFGPLLFRLGSKGTGAVFDLDQTETDEQGVKQKKAGDFTLSSLDKVIPHSNSVFFGPDFWQEGDEFPLLYTNVYNNYGKKENALRSDRREGQCCVYRIYREGEDFRGDLVQLIQIGFTEDRTLWKSLPENGDVRPYGNFAADLQQRILYAFTMRDASLETRFFAFRLPDPHSGVMDPVLGVPCVTLTKEEILSQFDAPYSYYLQGAIFFDGKVYSCEGFTNNEQNPPRIRVFDVQQQKQTEVRDLFRWGLFTEPEMMYVRNGKVYYGDAAGNHYVLTR